MPIRQPEVPTLTGLRAIAALSVAVAHGATLVLTTPPVSRGLQHWLSISAGFGMTLFFVLSGFVIHYNYSDRILRGGGGGLVEFIWVRFARLYPLFLLVLVLDMMLGKRTGGAVITMNDMLATLPYYLVLAQSWVYTIIGTNSLIYQVGVNLPLTWSISTEWFFYLAYPLLCLPVALLRRTRYALIAAGAFSLTWVLLASALFARIPALDDWAGGLFGPVATMANGYQDSFVRWILYFSPYVRLGEFALGCLIAQLYIASRPVEPGPGERRFGATLLVVAALSIPFLLYLMYVPGGTSFVRQLSSNFGLAPSVAALMFCCARYEPRGTRWLSSRPMLALGEASYCIYLIHMLVFIGVARSTPPQAVVNALGATSQGLRFAFCLGIVILLALGITAVYEIPARRWLRSLAAGGDRRRRALAACIFFAPAVLALATFHGGYRLHEDLERRTKQTSGLLIHEASYGLNCGAQPGNATGDVQHACGGLTKCRYRVNVNRLGDPAPSCGKGFIVTYSCAGQSRVIVVELPQEAGFGGVVDLVCP